MTMKPSDWQHQYRKAGIVFLASCTICIGLALWNITGGSYLWAIGLGITALICGVKAFDAFEKVESMPVEQRTYELEVFGSTLKNGSEVDVLLEIQFIGEDDFAHAASRIRNQLQRSLSMYLSSIEGLSERPHTEIDGIIQSNVSDLKNELELKKLVIQTIDVKTKIPVRTTPGISFGSR